MKKEEKEYPISNCPNCQTLTPYNNKLCLNCGKILLSNKLLCSKCNSPVKKSDVKCNVCGLELKEKKTERTNWEKLYPADKQRFIDMITVKRGKESILRDYGEKGFDTFTGYLDWDFLGLYEIVEEELKFFETAQ